MPPKKRGRGALTPQSKSKPDIQTCKPDPSPFPPPRLVACETPSPAVGPTARSLSRGPTANKDVGPTVGALSLPAGPRRESADAESNAKKKVVRKVVRKVPKFSLTGGTESRLVDAKSKEKNELEKANPTANRLATADSKPSIRTSPVEAVVRETPVVPTVVLTPATESLTSGPEQNTQRSCEVMEPGLAKGKVKKVLRKVIKKKIVKKLVPKRTLASMKAAEGALAIAKNQAESANPSCNVKTGTMGEEKEKSLVPGVNPSDNFKHNKEKIGLAIGENNGTKGEKSNEREGNSGENPNSKFGNKKEEEEGKEAVARLEGGKENNNKIGSVSWNRKEINDEIKVGDEIRKEKVECSTSNSEKKKVCKVIKKKIVKKLVPKGTLLVKRCAKEKLNQAARSEAENPNANSKETLIPSEKTLNQKPSSNTGTEPEQYKAKKTVVSNKESSNGETPYSSSNAETQKQMHIEVLKERQKRKLGTIPAKQPAEETVTLAEKIEADNPGPNTENEKPQQENIITISDKMPRIPNPSSNLRAEEMEGGMTERQKRRKTEIFIGGLDKEVREVDIRTVFEKAGEIVEVRMFMENSTGKNKGYCFLRYKEPAQAKKAIFMFSKVEVKKISTVVKVYYFKLISFLLTL